MSRASEAANGLSTQFEQVKEKLTESGESVAASAAGVRDQVAATAVNATDKTAEAIKALADQLPSSPQELEDVVKAWMESVRRNPMPWAIGAAAVGVIWLLGRRRH